MNKKLVVILWIIGILIAILLSSQSSNYLNYNENTTIPSTYPSAKAQELLSTYFHGGNINNSIDIVLVNSSPQEVYKAITAIEQIKGVCKTESIINAYIAYDEILGKEINYTSYEIYKENNGNVSTQELKEEIAQYLHVPLYYTCLFNTSPQDLLNKNETAFFLIAPPSQFTSTYETKNVSVIFVYTKYCPNYNFKNGTYPDGKISCEIHSKLSKCGLTNFYLTGPAPLVQELSGSENQRQAITFALVFIALLLITGIYFRSILAPIITLSVIALSVIFGMAIVTLVGKLYHPVDFQVIEPMISVLLGIGTDYSVFLLSRFKEELAKGKSKEDAMKISVKTSGKAILISGSAVTLVFLSLSFIPYLHTWGLTIGFSVPITVLLAVTLLPIIYGKIGSKIFWPSHLHFAENKSLGNIARVTMKKPKTTLLISLFVGLIALAFILSVPLSLDFTSGLPNIPAVKGLKILENAFGQSFVNPDLIVFNESSTVMNSTYVNTALLTEIAKIEENISRLSGVKQVIGPVPCNFNGTITPEILHQIRENLGTNNKTLLVTIIMNYGTYTQQAQNLVNTIQKMVKPYHGYVGGTTASVIDALDYLLPYYEMLIIILPIILIISLTAFLRSIKISIGAVGTILLSITLSLAIIYLLFRSADGILFFIPITIFVLMIGLGNDYSIFILTRVKEEIEKERNIESIVRAISISAGAVTALGVILAASFGVLAVDPIKPIAELGIGIAIAALLDTFVIRIFVYPAILKIALRLKDTIKRK
ncbi:MMPL family transporter [Acidianus sp. HS-5]|uniref:MMPL family transporter n=1 Tax=Acidianus sp. HS-5 TaxID=2886040 RepID=UPI001F031292|nr:MMPL family transporter [Acidianus sp. HS-5]BDC17138.1 antibiotic transport-associated protein [Acidianus sp. HS-5]